MKIWWAMGAGLSTALIWGAWPVYSRVGVVDGLSALDLSVLRFGVAGLVLLPLVIRKGLGGLRVWQAVLLTIGAGTPYVLASITGLSFAPASHGGIIIPGTMLMASTLGGWLILKDRPNRTRLVGLSLILAGVAFIGLDGWETGDSNAWIGAGFFMLSGLLWAVYTIGVKSFGADPFQATAVVSVMSMVSIMPFWLISGSDAVLHADLVPLLAHAGFQGILVAIGALYLYSVAVAYFGAGQGALFSALVPSVAVILAVPVLGELPSPLNIAGLLLTTMGMLTAFGAGQLLFNVFRKNTRSNPSSTRRSVSTNPIRS